MDRVGDNVPEREHAMNLMIAMVAIAWQATAGTADDPGRAGRLVQVAGGGTGGDGSSADRAELTGPFGVGFDGRGTLYFVEMTGHRVREDRAGWSGHHAREERPEGERPRRGAGAGRCSTGHIAW